MKCLEAVKMTKEKPVSTDYTCLEKSPKTIRD